MFPDPKIDPETDPEIIFRNDPEIVFGNDPEIDPKRVLGNDIEDCSPEHSRDVIYSGMFDDTCSQCCHS